jgi:hypothetical protein
VGRLREDGFEAIHGFGVAVLREQDIADGQVRGDGGGICRESLCEGPAGIITLVKVEQSIAKKDQRGGVFGMLLGVRAKKHRGFSRLVLRAKMLGSNKERIGLSVG